MNKKNLHLYIDLRIKHLEKQCQNSLEEQEKNNCKERIDELLCFRLAAVDGIFDYE